MDSRQSLLQPSPDPTNNQAFFNALFGSPVSSRGFSPPPVCRPPYALKGYTEQEVDGTMQTFLKH